MLYDDDLLAPSEDDLLTSLRRSIFFERQGFLSELSVFDINNTGMLDLPHQSLLRFAQAAFPDKIETILKNYFLSPQSRRDLLVRVQSLYCAENRKITRKTPPTLAGSGFVTHSVHLLRQFSALAKKLPPEQFVVVDNPFALAAFRRGNSETVCGVEIEYLDDDDIASTGALMYYGFSLGQNRRSLIQMRPLRVLALTLQCYARLGCPPRCGAAWREHHICSEIQRFVELAKPGYAFLEDVRQMIVLHEVGHHSYFSDGGLISKVLERFGVGEEDLYRPSFPSYEDLGSWRRIRAGSGSIRDVLFILGDFLANLSAVIANVSSPNLIYVFRTFHWWLLFPPSPKRRTRGISWFLSLTSDGNIDQPKLEETLDSVLSTALNRPSNIAKTLYSWDRYFWNQLVHRHDFPKSSLLQANS